MTLPGHEEVGGADIAMDDAGRMHAGQGLRELAGDVHADGPWQARMPPQKQLQRFACEVVQRVQRHRQMLALADQGSRFDEAGNIERLSSAYSSLKWVGVTALPLSGSNRFSRAGLPVFKCRARYKWASAVVPRCSSN